LTRVNHCTDRCGPDSDSGVENTRTSTVVGVAHQDDA
jgi:hypothetical protein